VLAFGNPDLDDPKMALQFAQIEAGEIKKLYPQSTVLLKKQATEGKAKSLSPQNDIVHFASHAELSEDDPLASAILLAKSDKEDGRLEVIEIFGMDLEASLVVLSACETGVGQTVQRRRACRTDQSLYLCRHAFGCCQSMECGRQQHRATDGELLQELKDDE
jgi:CHAT domain-containing protein